MEINSDDHEHTWRVYARPNILSCTVIGCTIIAPIATVIANAQADAAQHAKAHMLIKQLRRDELKKPAHVIALKWIMANTPESVVKLIDL